MKRFLPVLASLFVLGACTTPRITRVPISAGELAVMLKQPATKPLNVGVRFKVTGSRTLGIFGTVVKPGQPGMAEVIREFPYPTRMDLPIVSGPAGQPIPTTPTKFATRDTGWKLEDVTVIPQGAFYMLYGRFLETTFEGFIDNPGDGFRPIKGADGKILTDNRSASPTFTTRETPFIVSALPGRTYRLPLHLKQPGAMLEITCNGIDRHGNRVDPAGH